MPAVSTVALCDDAHTQRLPYWDVALDIEGQSSYTRINWLMLKTPEPSMALWDVCMSWSDEELRSTVETGWQEALAQNEAFSCDWVVAAKVYLWRRPLDEPWALAWRECMGPFWLHRIRCNTEDWAWFYANRLRMSLVAMIQLLHYLPAHSTGSAMVVEVVPQWQWSDSESSPRDWEIICSFLDKYGDVLLHPEHWLYPRWRAAVVCLHFDSKQRFQERKKREQVTVSKSCLWLGISTRRILQGYDAAWVAHLKSLRHLPRCLTQWDAEVERFKIMQQGGWIERARALLEKKSS